MEGWVVKWGEVVRLRGRLVMEGWIFRWNGGWLN